MKSIHYETIRLIETMINMGQIPSIHGTELLVFEDMEEELFQFIRRFSVLKKKENIRQVLQWKLNMVLGERLIRDNIIDGIPLSNIKVEDSKRLYNYVFDQRNTLLNLKKPLEIVLFRYGDSGQYLINILKKFKNINIKILLNPTDDSKSWFYPSREFNATGIPSAGKALVALAGDSHVKEFFTLRFESSHIGSSSDNSFYLFNNLLEQLKNPGVKTIRLIESARDAYNTAMKISSTKRNIIIQYLDAFRQEFDLKFRSNPDIIFPFDNLPYRSLIILGAYLHHNVVLKESLSWQSILNIVGKELLNVKEGNNALFVTEKRQFMIGVHENGIICFSETAIKAYSLIGNFYGIWLVSEKTDKSYINDFIQALKDADVELDDKPKCPVEYDKNELKVFKDTTIKIANKRQLIIVADMLNNRCTCINNPKTELQNRTTPDVEKTLKNADLIIYTDEYIETSVGGAMIVPGVREAIKGSHTNKSQLKICLSKVTRNTRASEMEIDINIDKIYRYASGCLKYKQEVHNWKHAGEYIDYILNLVETEHKNVKMNYKMLIKHQIFQQFINIEKNPKFGYFPSKSLSEAIISLAGLKRAGFIADMKFGLMLERFIPPEPEKDNLLTSGYGLFNNEATKLLSHDIKINYNDISRIGGFVFDIDMTLLPKNSYVFTDYPELANIFMRLLRNQFRLAIISGNSEEEQIPRIEGPLKREMDNDYSSLKNLIFYVNGGATKIYYDEDGNIIDKAKDDYSIRNAMDYDKLKISVNKALTNCSLKSFGLNDHEKAKFKDAAITKYPNLKLKASWETTDWKPLWLTPNELENYKSNEETIFFPWVEIRGKQKNEDKIASIAIKPTPEIKKNAEIRTSIITKIKEELGKDKGLYNLRSGGSTTIDITRVNADKVAALKDFIDKARLEQKYVYYFGDEFYDNGNDQPIADNIDLKEVTTIAVNSEEEPIGETIWIGRSPQAVLEFLEGIIVH